MTVFPIQCSTGRGAASQVSGGGPAEPKNAVLPWKGSPPHRSVGGAVPNHNCNGVPARQQPANRSGSRKPNEAFRGGSRLGLKLLLRLELYQKNVHVGSIKI